MVRCPNTMFSIVLGYLAGSVPFAFCLAQRRRVDVRVAGRGNLGTANVLQTTGAALILFRHRANVGRLRAGTERKMGARA
jgi:glycerol-3-phosphate acyltransferase PlsY